MSKPLTAQPVRFTRVSKTFGSTVAVREVSFGIEPGEFFSILGPSGCGKTTTLRLLAGFEQPDDDGGELRIGDQVVNRSRPYERNLGMVFQSYALFPHLTVARNVAFGLEQRRVPRSEIPARVRSALEMVRLPFETFANRKPAQLSGGQKQRVALARALVIEPPILLLDEPLGALDLKLRKEMQLELKALNRQSGVTFVYVTHDQEEALTMSDRIAVMDNARIAQIGTPAEIYEQPRTAFVARFIGESNFIEGSVVECQDDRVTLECPGGVVRANGQRPVGDRARLAVRPENLSLAPADSKKNGQNTVDGTISQIIYRGEMLHVRVTVVESDDLLVAVPNRGQLHSPVPWQQGQKVRVAWDLGNGRLLEDEPP